MHDDPMGGTRNCKFLRADQASRIRKFVAATGSFSKLQSVVLWASVILLAIGSNGCNRSGGAVKVHGRISYKGEPLKLASVTFFPAKGRPVAAAALQGEYTTELPPGEYTAVVDVGVERPAGFKPGDPEPKPKVVLPDQYAARTTSPLKATVKAGQSEPIDFDLK